MESAATDSPAGIPPLYEDAQRWLWVEKAKGQARGGWVTGSFDPAHNKITIETKDVDRFALDTGKIGIDWERLVVLRLDSANSELRRRDYDVLHFVRDRHNRWVVKEPGTAIDD